MSTAAVLDVFETTISGTAAEQTRKVLCGHLWWPHPLARIFGYLYVDAVCVLCRTRRHALGKRGQE